MSDLTTDSVQDRELIKQAQDGNQDAFEKLFSNHRPFLRQVVEFRLDTRARSRVDPSDIVQETYLEAHRRMRHYLEEQPMPFRLWLRQIAYDRARKTNRTHVTAQRRSVVREIALPEKSSLALAQQLLADAPTPSQELDQRELGEQLREAVYQLSEMDREIIFLRHYEGLSNHEVACLLEIKPGTASKRHARALLQLHALFFTEDPAEAD